MIYLLFLSASDIHDAIITVLYSIFLIIANIIYGFIDILYQIFMAIASAQVLSTDLYVDLANRIYVVIGVTSLFFIAYALLRAIVDPDSSSKGEMSVGKIVPNLLKTIVLIAFVPTIFNFAFNLQGVFLKTNVIGYIFLGSNDSSINEDYKDAGRTLANEIFINFFEPKDVSSVSTQTANSLSSSTITCDYSDKNEDRKTCLSKVSNSNGYTLYDAYETANTKGLFVDYISFADNAAKGDIDFNWVFQFIAGCFVVYCLISFCIDMGLRSIKLAYYEIIAPIPILTRIIPSQKKIFDTWMKNTISTFIEVFIRVFVLIFGVYMIKNLPSNGADIWSQSLLGNPPVMVRIFARIFVIMGIIMFIKQAPKLISDLFGIQSGTFKLGIGDKLREGGVFGAVGAAGAIGLSAANKIGHNYTNEWANAKGKGISAHVGAIAKGTGKSINPLNLIRYGSAGLNGYKATKDAKSISDFGFGVEKGVAEGLSKPSIASSIMTNGSDLKNAFSNSIKTEFTPGSRAFEKYQKRISTVESADVRKQLRDIARSSDAATITSNRYLNNFDGGAMDISAATTLLRQKRLSDINDARTKLINGFKTDPSTRTAANLEKVDSLERIIYGTTTDADRETIHGQLEAYRDASEKAYIDEQAATAGTKTWETIVTANSVIKANKDDELFSGVNQFDPKDTTRSVYDDLKANHTTIAGNSTTTGNIDELRSKADYINAAEIDRRSKENAPSKDKK